MPHATDCPACADETNLTERRAVARLEDYLIRHGMGGSYADKAECIGHILDAVNEGQMPDQGPVQQ